MPNNLLTIWPEAFALLLTAWVMVALLPQRHQQGSIWLLIGYAIIFVATLAALFFNPTLTGPMLSPGSKGYLSLVIQTIDLIGFSLIGLASWIKIKGKVTHHFIKIVCIIYLLLLILTVGLAMVMVHDQTSLQLLVVLITGLLITILPVIHSLTYSHPHQPATEAGPKL